MNQNEQSQHPASRLPIDQRIAYLSSIASLCMADGAVSDDEVANLRTLCASMQVSGKHIGTVLGAAEEPDSDAVRACLRTLSGSELRFTFITDLFLLAHADGVIDKDEQREIDGMAEALGLTDEQVGSIREYVNALNRAMGSDAVDKSDLKDLGAEAAAGLAGAGVPIAAVGAAGSVAGFSAAGITSGLAALGMGFGMLSGIGTAVAIGAGSYMGVKYLYRKWKKT